MKWWDLEIYDNGFADSRLQRRLASCGYSACSRQLLSSNFLTASPHDINYMYKINYQHSTWDSLQHFHKSGANLQKFKSSARKFPIHEKQRGKSSTNLLCGSFNIVPHV